ncbi:hypothetical protein QTN47_22480 [Danxiaibacter flavus]|uniref:HTH luxR-type domain-containing protein n=1 Tax=Danxiaibacter flavus TaxID=3049108 RepID=A0ABV3ZK73_9BACT|nr:hypothetical protein QNM32_22485 [Chitinophagaceae bacterium DXS]
MLSNKLFAGLIIPLLVFSFKNSSGQKCNRLPGIPNVINFSKDVYGGNSQNWSATQTASGIMAFGNAIGALCFDGSRWEVRPSPSNSLVRSVAASSDGRLYVGGYRQIGYWSGPAYNHYTNLDSLFFKDPSCKEEIWKIIPTSEFVLFQSFSRLFLLYNDGTAAQIVPPHPFIFVHQVNDRLFLPIEGDRMYEIKNRRLVEVPGSEALKKLTIRVMLPFNGNSILLGTDKNGLWLFSEQGELQKINTSASTWLASNSLSCGMRLNTGDYLFATTNNGVLIADNDLQVVQHVNKSNGLQCNTILNATQDCYKNVWLVQEKGIDLLVMNAPLRYVRDPEDMLGTVLHATTWNGKLYLATNHGLFSQKLSGNLNSGSQFEKVKNSDGLAWHVSVWDDQLIIGHEKGTYTLENDQLRKLDDSPGGWDIVRPKINTDYLLQGNYNGLVLLKKNNNGKWTFFRKIKEAEGLPLRNLVQDKMGRIWLKHAKEGIYCLRLDTAMNVKDFKLINETQGVIGNEKPGLVQYNGDIFLTTPDGMKKWDDRAARFIKDTSLKQILGAYWRAPKMIAGDNGDLWAINKRNDICFFVADKNHVLSYPYVVNPKNFSLNYDFEQIVPTSENYYVLCGEEGIATFSNMSYAGSLNTVKPFFLQLLIHKKGGWQELDIENDQKIVIPYGVSQFRLKYAMPVFDRDTRFRYKIQDGGSAQPWSEWTALSEKEFINMRPGDYVFLLETNVNSKSAMVTFTILPPWYWSIYAQIFYLAFLFTGALLTVKWAQNKMRRQKEKIQRKMNEELATQKEQFERAQERVKKAQLERDLELKEKELANSAIGLVKKNEFLEKLRNDLAQVKESNRQMEADAQLNKIIRQINKNIQTEKEDWELFESRFNAIHDGFYQGLLNSYPGLTPQDLKLAACLKMNLTSKEIAPIFNISVKGVELKRYRLRRKLNLSAEQNLTEFFLRL